MGPKAGKGLFKGTTNWITNPQVTYEKFNTKTLINLDSEDCVAYSAEKFGECIPGGIALGTAAGVVAVSYTTAVIVTAVETSLVSSASWLFRASLLLNGRPNTVSAPTRNVQETVNRATSFAGSRRFPLDYAPYQKIRCGPNTINGIKYSGHALDRMQDRGIMPSIVENTIKIGQKSFNKIPGRTQYYDEINRVRVICDELGRVITIIPGRI